MLLQSSRLSARASSFMIASLVCFFYLVAAPCHSAQTPKDCLQDISQAMSDGDGQTFQELVALDPILQDCMNVFLKEAARPENAADLPPMLTMLFTQNSGAAGQAIKTMLLGTARAFVMSGVESGAFAGKKISSQQSQSLLTPLFAHASIGRKEIRNIGSAIADNGDWLLPFSVRDHGNGNDYPVVGRFRKGENGIYLAGIENLEQIFAQIQKEAKGL